MKTSEGSIHLFDAHSFKKMQAAGELAAQVLDFIRPFLKTGVTTLELNDLCDDFIRKNDAIPAPLNYKGFPKSICTSLNHVVCHGIPDQNKLKAGDILNIDVTVIKEGWYGDTSRMFAIENILPHAQRLIDTTYQALMEAIRLVKPGAYLGDIGYCIQTIAHAKGFSVVKEYCGHGIGDFFHHAPSVLHYGQKGTGLQLKPGMVFTIEPMLNAKKEATKVLADGWTVVTKDRGLSAQWEHTVGVTESGAIIFTKNG